MIVAETFELRRERRLFGALQWGRDLIVAETESRESDGGIGQAGFNGAAT